MNNWEILGIPATDDLTAVKKAYAKKSKLYHPETHPEEFQQLYRAYKSVVSTIKMKTAHNTVSNSVAGADSNDNSDEIDNNSNSFTQKEHIPKKTSAQILADIQAEEATRQAETEAALKLKQQLLDDEAFLAWIDKDTEEKKNADYKRFRMAEFETMLENRCYPNDWKQYFTTDEFLDNQYNPNYIKALATAIDKKLKQPVAKMAAGGGRCPQYAFIYIVIAYGCMFDKVGSVPISENVYKIELLEPLQQAFRLYDSMLLSYILTESKEDLLGERFAFYVYRNILALLEKNKPDRDTLCQWIAWGMARENHTHVLDICHYSPSHGKWVSPTQTRHHDKIKRSPLIFELLSYILEKPSTPLVFKQVLREVCEAYMSNLYCCEEIRILHLMLED